MSVLKPLKTQQSEGYFSKCREMFLNYQPLPVLQFLLKKQMTAKTPGPFLAEWVDSTYNPGDFRVRHHPLKHLDIALTSLFIQGDSFLPSEVLVIYLKPL
jgi:hypothetical protein